MTHTNAIEFNLATYQLMYSGHRGVNDWVCHMDGKIKEET